ncbi:sulfotransferase domain-containing protein [Imperialibacter roseus]|uniref:Sulfotransferase domain-containing protein n=1 Tax=Imperialibacter roseus TaxID=1324217 RepID=A0ABZ0IK27_9BACT|nr:sulfotransferase domain-containing protein [Imperialibacter roseus]WOK05374.1 sulfotransferase domain-containing protein [Imperialibacter roseus]
MKPSFLIAGIMKSGTSFLDDLMRGHPQIYMPERNMKFSYFDDDRVFRNGPKWYESIFIPPSESSIIGQTSADCAFNPGSIERIKELVPDVKLIFVIRSPIERAYSLYWHQIRMGREISSFEDVISSEKLRTKRSYYDFKMYSYIQRSRYKRQFDIVFDYFDEANIRIIPFELLIHNEVYFLNYLFEFVGVDKIESMDELSLDVVKKNPAKLPSSKLVLHLSYRLQKLGFLGVGRYILNKTLVEARPPKIDPSTKEKLEAELHEDIAFHKAICQKFEKELIKSSSQPLT